MKQKVLRKVKKQAKRNNINCTSRNNYSVINISNSSIKFNYRRKWDI